MPSIREKRAKTRSSLSALFADIPRKRRAIAIQRAWFLFQKQLDENEMADTKYDDKGRILRLGTSARDRAAVTKDTLESMRILADIYHKSCEHDAAIEKLILGVLGGSGAVAPTIHVHYPGAAPAVTPPATLMTAATNDPSSSNPPEPAPSAGSPGDPK